VLRGHPANDQLVQDYGMSARHEVSRTVTDTNGKFTLAPSAGNEHIVVVGRYSEPQVESARLDTSAGAHVSELELVLAGGARLFVHIEPPTGLTTAEWKLVFVRSGLVPPGVFATPLRLRGHRWPVRARTDRGGARLVTVQ
jgi:fructose/tagatose bisphosphate aldolase